MGIKNLTLNQKLGALAIFLGFLALILPDPTKSEKVVVDVNELAAKIQDESVQISVQQLADDIIQGKADFMLIDLSDSKKYEEYHIPFAVNLRLNQLTPDEVPRNERIILYSDDEIKTAQAWFLLKSNNYKGVYLLKGGLDEWKKCILFPKLSEPTTAEEKARNAKLAEISKFFGGRPQIAGAEAVEQTNTMALPKPKLGAVKIKRKKKKPAKEGC